MARKNAGGPNSLAVRDNTPQGISNSNPHPGKQDTKHRSSSPTPMRTQSRGGASLAVKDNANCNYNVPNPSSIPVHNGSPATRKSYPTSPESPPTRGGRKVKGA